MLHSLISESSFRQDFPLLQVQIEQERTPDSGRSLGSHLTIDRIHARIGQELKQQTTQAIILLRNNVHKGETYYNGSYSKCLGGIPGGKCPRPVWQVHKVHIKFYMYCSYHQCRIANNRLSQPFGSVVDISLRFYWMFCSSHEWCYHSSRNPQINKSKNWKLKTVDNMLGIRFDIERLLAGQSCWTLPHYTTNGGR